MSDLSDLSDLSDKKGAPVFALTGYAVASLGIPRGFACRCGWARGEEKNFFLPPDSHLFLN